MYKNFDKIIKHDKTLDESDKIRTDKNTEERRNTEQRRGRTKIVKTRKDIINK